MTEEAPDDRPGLLGLSEAEIEAILAPVKMPPASGDWISAREARLMVADMAAVTLDEAAAALCRRALKWLRVRPHTWSRGEQPHDYIDRLEFFRSKPKPELSHFSDAPSRPDWDEGLELFNSLQRHIPLLAPDPGVQLACWATGDFHVNVEMDFSIVEFRIVGLEFDKAGVLESIGARGRTGTPGARNRVGGPGRAPKWDWESAIARVVAVANTPDGLPAGRGAQAAIEAIIADYFGDECPAESQIRLRAAKIMEALEAARR